MDLAHLYLHLVQLLCDYLLASDLCQLALTGISKSEGSWADTIENAWYGLCNRRWRFSNPSRIMRSLSVKSWKDTYRLMHLRQTIPEGVYTLKKPLIFAKGMNHSSLVAWFMLSHGKNAMLKLQVNYNNKIWNQVPCRLCLQNLSGEILHLPVSMTTLKLVEIKCISSDGDSECPEDDILPTDQYSLLSFNGLSLSCKLPTPINDVNSEIQVSSTIKSFNSNEASQDNLSQRFNDDILILNPLDFCVLSFNTLCPNFVLNEPDFLTMIRTIHVNTIGAGRLYNGSVDCETSLQLDMMNEEEILSNYDMLPSGVTLLVDRARSELK